MDASSGMEPSHSEDAQQEQSRETDGGVSLPHPCIQADEAGAAQTNVGLQSDHGHDVDSSDDSHLNNVPRSSGSGSDTGSDAAQACGDLFSPDSSELVTVICKKDENSEDQDQEKCDGYETHSDSVETLEEDEDGQNHHSGYTECDSGPSDLAQDFSKVRLTDPMQNEDAQEVFEKESALELAKQGILNNTGTIGSEREKEARKDLEIESSSAANRPESLSLPRPLQYYERKRSSTSGEVSSKTTPRGHQRSQSEAMDIENSGTRRLKGDLGCGDDIMSTSLPHGTLLRKGELIEFVADDLTEKIKRSSPMSRADSSSLGSRRSSQRSIASTSSATSTSVTSGVSRSPSSLLTQSPDAAPPIDPCAVMELEMAARRVADSVDLMMGNLRNNLHKMSAITVGCSEAYKTSVDITCDSVDSSIKSMYALMAKCEELSSTMGPIYQLGGQIKEIKRLLDLFESQLTEKS